MITRLTSIFEALRSLAQSRKLAKPAYRQAMVDAEIRHGLADQIRAMRERAGWSQADLARRIGTSQPNVARMEATRDKYLSLPSLLSVAKVFDVGLLVRFVPFSEVVRRSLDATDFEQAPLSYEEEVRFTAQIHVFAPRSTATFAPPPSLEKRTQVITQPRLASPAPYVDVA